MGSHFQQAFIDICATGSDLNSFEKVLIKSGVIAEKEINKYSNITSYQSTKIFR